MGPKKENTVAPGAQRHSPALFAVVQSAWTDYTLSLWTSRTVIICNMANLAVTLIWCLRTYLFYSLHIYSVISPSKPAQTPSHLTPVSEVFSSCHFLLSWARQRMLSDFQPSGHSRIFSLEGSAGEAKVEAKRQRRGKVEIDPRHTGKRGSRRPQSSCGVTDKGCHS